MSLQFKPIQALLHTGTNKASRWFSYIGLCIGVLLLLASIQMFINIQQLVKETAVSKTGSEFISITKIITNETMGRPEKNVFYEEEIEEIRSQTFIEDVAPLESNRFRVQLSAGEILAFKTDLFLESIKDEFIDTLPAKFTWQEGQSHIPVIISSDYLEAYNIFAPAQGLPQVSSESATNIPVIITVSGNGRRTDFYGSVVAFSDRINSVIVPKPFLDWANQNFGETAAQGFGRLFIKTPDANSPELLSFLDEKGYRINKDRTQFGRARQVLQGIFTGLGVFGVLVVVMALMLFSFYLQLVISRSRDNLQLLLLMGYSPLWLSRNVAKKFIPVYVVVVLAALVVTQAMQWFFHRVVMYGREELTTAVHWLVLALAVLLIILSAVINYRLIKKLLYKLG